MKSKLCLRHAAFFFSAACVLCLSQGLFPARVVAAPLNLTSAHPGDVTTHYMSVTYSLDANPLTGTLVATGEPDQFDVNDQFIFNSSFNLTMTVDRATGVPVTGSLTIIGDILDGPTYSGLLLQGEILPSFQSFGFKDPPVNAAAGEGGILEFRVHVTGGELHAPYYVEDWAGVILTMLNNVSAPPFTGIFTSPWSNTAGNALSDTFPISDPQIPEPSSIVLLGIGLVPLAWRARRRFSKSC